MLEFPPQVFLHRLALLGSPSSELVANVIGHVPDGDLLSHARILPALPAFCKHCTLTSAHLLNLAQRVDLTQLNFDCHAPTNAFGGQNVGHE